MKSLSARRRLYRATKQCFPSVLFVRLYKVVIILEPLDEILKGDIQMKVTEQCCGAVCNDVQGDSNFNLSL